MRVRVQHLDSGMLLLCLIPESHHEDRSLCNTVHAIQRPDAIEQLAPLTSVDSCGSVALVFPSITFHFRVYNPEGFTSIIDFLNVRTNYSLAEVEARPTQGEFDGFDFFFRPVEEGERVS